MLGQGATTATSTNSKWQAIVSNGNWVQLKLNGKPVGLVTDCGYDESFNVQPIKTLNRLQALGYDPTGYTCSISIGAYIPNKAKYPTGVKTPDDGEVHANDILNIDVEQVWETGIAPEWDSMEFYDSRAKKTLAAFSGVILDKNSGKVNKEQAVTMNLSLYAVKRDQT